MDTLKIAVVDGRRFQGWPNAVFIKANENTAPFYVSPATWDNLTRGAKLPTDRFSTRKITAELYRAFWAARIVNVDDLPTGVETPGATDGSCTRCGGAGKIEAYRHINGGTCFECNGTGKRS
jgi:hypothetical protein